MTKSGLSKSVRKYIKKEKARIRREFFDIAKQKQEIKKIYEKFKSDSSQHPQSP